MLCLKVSLVSGRSRIHGQVSACLPKELMLSRLLSNRKQTLKANPCIPPCLQKVEHQAVCTAPVTGTWISSSE